MLEIIKGWEKLSAVDIDFLQHEVEFVIVTIPEALAMEQLDDIFDQFQRHELNIRHMIINNVIKDTSSDFLLTKSRQQQTYIDALSHRYPNVHKIELPLFPHEIKGIDKLKDIERQMSFYLPQENRLI